LLVAWAITLKTATVYFDGPAIGRLDGVMA
jgi:hypothetical protein